LRATEQRQQEQGHARRFAIEESRSHFLNTLHKQCARV
jgi:hypothetical protein